MLNKYSLISIITILCLTQPIVWLNANVLTQDSVAINSKIYDYADNLKTTNDCNCNILESAIILNQIAISTEKCEYEFKLSTELEKCVQKLEWLLDGNGFSQDWSGTFGVTTGSHTLTLKVLLSTGEECTIHKKMVCGGCNCDYIKGGIKVNALSQSAEGCKYELGIAEELKECIRKVEWASDFGFSSTDLVPGTMLVPAGTNTLKLRVTLLDGTVCEFCTEITCRKPCKCDEEYAKKVAVEILDNNFGVSDVEKCLYKVAATELDDCYQTYINWGDSGNYELIPSGTSLTHTYSTDDTYDVQIEIRMPNGDVCYKYHKPVKVVCKNCNCDDIESAVTITKPIDSSKGCKYDFELSEELKGCVEKLEWVLDGTTISNDFSESIVAAPGPHVFQLNVLLSNGEECTVTEEVVCYDCNCKDILDNIITKYPDSNDSCQLQPSIAEEWQKCIKAIEWSTTFGFSSTELDAGIISIPPGTHQGKVTIVLENGDTCRASGEISCQDCYDCETLEKGIKFGKIALNEEGCIYQMGIIEELHDCIKEVKWYSESGFSSDEFIPNEVKLPCGTEKVFLLAMLDDGTECKYEFEVECESCCDCNNIKAGIKVSQLDVSAEGCKYQLGIAEELEDCIESVQWETDFGFSSNELNPDNIAVPCGTHTLKLQVTLKDGTTCEFCREITCGDCCECDEDYGKKIVADIINNQFGLADEEKCMYRVAANGLDDCYEVFIDWGDGGSFENIASGIAHTYIANDTYQVCFEVRLKDDGKVCYKICIEIKVSCADKCKCDEEYAQEVGESMLKSIDLIDEEKCIYQINAPNSNECYELFVNWGDGAGFENIPIGTNLNHVYVDNGSFDICVEVRNAITGEVCFKNCRAIETKCKECGECDPAYAKEVALKIVENYFGRAYADSCLYVVKSPELKGCHLAEIDWGDGSDVEIIYPNQALQHHYAVAGSYEVCIKIRLPNGEECAAYCAKKSISCECLDHVLLTEPLSGKHQLDISNTITAVNIFENGSEVTLQASKTISFMPGFQVKAGGQLTASIVSPIACLDAIIEKEEVKKQRLDLNNSNAKGFNSTQATLKIAPNPFNDQTTITYFLPIEDNLQLKIFDVNGQLIETISTTTQEKGWHQINYQSKDLAPGIYYIVLQTSQNLVTKKVITHNY